MDRASVKDRTENECPKDNREEHPQEQHSNKSPFGSVYGSHEQSQHRKNEPKTIAYD